MDEAEELIDRFITMALASKDSVLTACACIAHASVAAARRDDREAARLLGAVDVILGSVSRTLDPDDAEELERVRAHVTREMHAGLVSSLAIDGAQAGARRLLLHAP